MPRTFDLGLFSAQPKDRVRLEPQHTARWPSNVPTVVDNLWEWHRARHHNNYPSRRYAVYALPCQDLAKEHCSADNELIVRRVILHDCFKLCQVRDRDDSKNHPDCQQLQTEIRKHLALDGTVTDKGWNSTASLRVKQDIGRLWIPALTHEEIETIGAESQTVRRLLQAVEPNITYWTDCILVDENTVEPGNGGARFENGEIFFEPTGGGKFEALKAGDEQERGKKISTVSLSGRLSSSRH